MVTLSESFSTGMANSISSGLPLKDLVWYIVIPETKSLRTSCNITLTICSLRYHSRKKSRNRGKKLGKKSGNVNLVRNYSHKDES